MIKIGKVKKPHGLRGEITIEYFSFYEEFPYNRIYMKIGGEFIPFKVENKKGLRKLILKLEGIDSRDQSEKLKGMFIYVKREEFPEPEEDEYYWVDLLGVKVEREDGKILGTVEDIIPIPSADVLSVRGSREYLIPLHKKFIVKLELPERIITKRIKGITELEDEKI